MDQPGPSQATRLLSKDPAIEGFDISAGETWIYPTNYSTREYQFNIIQKALLENTLVSLPTGLGKTFIAAVVMYNFYRWYPEGKMIFMAPTKPLVKQQVDACYNIMAIPEEATAELTGAKQSTARTDIWTEKRVFYITPQVLHNDLNRIEQLGPKIKCLVFDEAHKARGNHAYCEVIQRLTAQGHTNFRVLALSATPGNSVNDVLEILEYYTKNLKTYNIIQGNCGSLTKGKIFMLLKDFQQRHRGAGSGNYAEISRTLNICVTLYHAFELLIRHGLRNFMSFFEEHMEKPLLKNNHQIRAIVEDIRRFLGPLPNIEKLPDGTYPEVPTNIKFGHPKHYKLRDILVDHFQTSEKNTRVIVFFEYRESVMEAHLLLLQSRPLLQPKIFLGQGSGITQKTQIGVVKAFREGRCNVLLSTCIGEEGLDVGEVDLIICFDISTRSPIRMVQRMGRTGRKRAGKVLVLVTEGKEQQTLKDCLIQKSNISTFVLGSKQLSSGMYPQSPRLVPENITPRCEKIFITVKKKNLILKKNGSIKDMLNSISSASSELVLSQDLPLSDKPERIKNQPMFFDKGGFFGTTSIEKNILSKHIEKQRKLQKTHKIKHSKSSETLVKLLQLSDSKRFNLPTQTQTTQHNTKVLKQEDIRNMFLTNKSQDCFEPPKSTNNFEISTQEISKKYEKVENEDVLNEEFVGSVELFAQISNFIFLKTTNPQKICQHCPDDFNCEDFKISMEECDVLNNNWVPSDKIFEGITAEDLRSFAKSLDPKNEEESVIMDDDESVLNNVNFTQLKEQEDEKLKKENEKSFRFEAPESFNQMLQKFGDSIIEIKVSEEELLLFLKYDNLTDVFEAHNTTLSSSQETIVYSPQVADLKTPERPDNFEEFVIEDSESPIISSEDQLKMLRRKLMEKQKKLEVKQDLFDGKCSTLVTEKTSPYFRRKSEESSDIKAQEKQNEDICDISSFFKSKSEETKQKEESSSKEDRSRIIPLSELVDESLFDLLTSPVKEDKSKEKSQHSRELFEDLIDESLLDLLTQPKDSKNRQKSDTERNSKPNQTSQEVKSNNKNSVEEIKDFVDESFLDLLTQIPEDKNEKKPSKLDLETTSLDTSIQLNSKLQGKIPSEDLDMTFVDLATQPNRKLTKEDSEEDFETSTSIRNTPTLPNSKLREKLPSEDLDVIFVDLATQPNRKLTKEDSEEDFETSTTITRTPTLPNSKLREKLSREDLDETFVDLASQPNRKLTKKDSEDDFDISTTICDNKNNKKLDIENNLGTNNIVGNLDSNVLWYDEKIPGRASEMERSNSEDLFEDTITNIREKEHKTQRKTKKDNEDIEFEETWLATPVQRSSKPRNGVENRSKTNTDVKDIEFEETWFATPLQSSNKPRDEKEDYKKKISTVVDLTLDDSPPKSTPNRTPPKTTQLCITQMLNLINKTQSSTNKAPRNAFGSQTQGESVLKSPKALFCSTQRTVAEPLMISTQKKAGNSSNFGFDENCGGSSNSQKETETNQTNNNSPSSDNNRSLNDSFKARKNLLSTNRKRFLNETEDEEFELPKKALPKPKIDPYEFITQRKTSNRNQVALNKSNEEKTSSDDEFEVQPKRSSVFLKPKATSVVKRGEKESERKNKVKNKENPFLDLEAKLSEEDSVFVSSDEDDKDSDDLDDSFVVPNATMHLDSQMHAHYLQSVKSPAINGGRFKIPQRPHHNISNVYSQPVNYLEENTYLEDSFCVDEEESQIHPTHDLSELEILEMKLKNKKKKRKTSEKNPSGPTNKRRRIILTESDSD